ncbi:MAG TPA: right-handed parallel beta-helix repeat-containing protein [Methanofastidiosum sp.]|nr:right-handed parallel beta-helix repeat-containing protein [Methanofastidiosum sp.]HPA49085.1 right-handed parallel beta-helix repeat-containing protein [Methanofastidiosum sp.]HQK62901.1 right-handed parallel beta-helix repeat-containing protein [Methanofastidiosum sp.]HQQ49266.1 right-handed parallel beta-helix repeat-containing protein [Methanofastidiosum sp.]
MNKIKSILIMAILLASVLIVISPVSAATYNVYPGDDIEAIIESATSGDTIYIHAGTYYPTGTITVSGHPSIIGDTPSNTIIDFNHINGGIDASSQDGVTIKNITVKNSTGVGIRVDEECLVENCIVYGSGDNGFFADEDSTFKNCLSYGNNGDGFNDDEDCTYINCTSVGNKYDGFYSDEGGTKVINCIAVANMNDGFDIEEEYGPSEIIYSNAWNNDDEDYDEQGPGIGSISVDPKFVDGLNTFYLSTSSPCVDKGSEPSAALGLYEGFTTRTDGIWDKGTVDMGFHYTSNRGPPSSLPMDKILKILKGNQEE